MCAFKYSNVTSIDAKRKRRVCIQKLLCGKLTSYIISVNKDGIASESKQVLYSSDSLATLVSNKDFFYLHFAPTGGEVDRCSDGKQLFLAHVTILIEQIESENLPWNSQNRCFVEKHLDRVVRGLHISKPPSPNDTDTLTFLRAVYSCTIPVETQAFFE
ncbi:hypothetical protein ACNR90_002286 [Candidozyma auris]